MPTRWAPSCARGRDDERLHTAAPKGGAFVPRGGGQGKVDAIRFSLGELFERHIEVENGRDPLTRMLSHRFLPTVLTQEIALHRRRKWPAAWLTRCDGAWSRPTWPRPAG